MISFPNQFTFESIGMKSSADPAVWSHAKSNDFIIVSKDVDMHDLSLILGNPPKVIWVRLGNCSTSEVRKLLRTHYNSIKEFYDDDELSLIALP